LKFLILSKTRKYSNFWYRLFKQFEVCYIRHFRKNFIWWNFDDSYWNSTYFDNFKNKVKKRYC
jgi:hypothetical protein